MFPYNLGGFELSGFGEIVCPERYNIWLDTHKGPLVVELPPKVLGIIDDFWNHWVADAGITGADKGQGGKYLMLPPGYTGEVPQGYFIVKPSTHGNWLMFRGYLVDGSTKPAVETIKKTFRIYQLADAANPPGMKFADASGVPASLVFPTDYSFWNQHHAQGLAALHRIDPRPQVRREC